VPGYTSALPLACVPKVLVVVMMGRPQVSMICYTNLRWQA